VVVVKLNTSENTPIVWLGGVNPTSRDRERERQNFLFFYFWSFIEFGLCELVWVCEIQNCGARKLEFIGFVCYVLLLGLHVRSA
jgi:hypothetical protein